MIFNEFGDLFAKNLCPSVAVTYGTEQHNFSHFVNVLSKGQALSVLYRKLDFGKRFQMIRVCIIIVISGINRNCSKLSKLRLGHKT